MMMNETFCTSLLRRGVFLLVLGLHACSGASSEPVAASEGEAETTAGTLIAAVGGEDLIGKGSAEHRVAPGDAGKAAKAGKANSKDRARKKGERGTKDRSGETAKGESRERTVKKREAGKKSDASEMIETGKEMASKKRGREDSDEAVAIDGEESTVTAKKRALRETRERVRKSRKETTVLPGITHVEIAKNASREAERIEVDNARQELDRLRAEIQRPLHETGD